VIVSLGLVEGKGSCAYPAGSGGGGEFWPLRSSRSFVLAAALPCVGMLPAEQASRWSCGRTRLFWSSRGASTKVAIKPDVTCHSMWQWNSQMPVPGQLIHRY
jgi:hypothetical protein